MSRQERDEFVGGYSGSRPAAEMGPPARIASASHDTPITIDVRINGNVISESDLHETIRRAVVDYRKRNP